jgi:hypothetical protein
MGAHADNDDNNVANVGPYCVSARARKNRKQLHRRLKRKAKRTRREAMLKSRETHCCTCSRCRHGWACRSDKRSSTSDKDSDLEEYGTLIKRCLYVDCYKGDERHIGGGPWFGLKLVCKSITMATYLVLFLAATVPITWQQITYQQDRSRQIRSFVDLT